MYIIDKQDSSLEDKLRRFGYAYRRKIISLRLFAKVARAARIPLRWSRPRRFQQDSQEEYS